VGIPQTLTPIIMTPIISSTAAASVVHALGLCNANINVHMPGGIINIKLDEQFFATMTGDVRKICEGEISSEALGSL